MASIFNSVVDFLSEDGWKYTILEEEAQSNLLALTLTFRGNNGSWNCFCIVDEAKCWLRFYSMLHVTVPTEKRNAMAEFLSRANYGLMLGNFELDMTDGEVRFKSSIDCEGGQLTTKMIHNLLTANLITMDRYYHALMAVLYSDRTPESIHEEMARVEGTSTSEDEFS